MSYLDLWSDIMQNNSLSYIFCGDVSCHMIIRCAIFLTIFVEAGRSEPRGEWGAPPRFLKIRRVGSSYAHQITTALLPPDFQTSL